MNILYLCHRIPYPPNKGDKIRSFNEIKYLSKKHNIHLACLIDDKKDLAYVDDLKKYCRTVDYEVINPRWRKVRSLPYIFSHRPLTVPFFYSGNLQDSIDRRLSEIKFDVVFAFSSPMAEYVFRSKKLNGRSINGNGGHNDKGPKLIMDFVDVDSDKWRMYSEHSSYPKSIIYKNEWKRLMAYEKKTGDAFDVNIFVSDAEVRLFNSFAPDVNACTIPNGVDFDFYNNKLSRFNTPGRLNNSGSEQARADGQHGPEDLNLLFTGAMDYFANEDGVLHFHKNIWPVIKKEKPLSRFYIVGGSPSNKLKRIMEKDNDIIVTGYVDDIRPYMWKADIFVAPLRIARGVQNKILEAMAAGLPVVATPQAAQGVRLNGDDFIFVEDSPLKFAERTVSLAGKSLNNEVISRRESFLRHNYEWDENLIKLENIIQQGGQNDFKKM